MRKFYKLLLTIFLVVCVLLFVHYINIKLDVASIPPSYFVSQVSEVKVDHLNFDENNKENVIPYLSKELTYSGVQSMKVTPSVEFVDLFEYYLPERNNNEYLNSVRLDLMIFAQSRFSEVVVVVEITDFSGKMVQWKNVRLNPTSLNQWEHIYHSVYLNSEARAPQNKIKVYLWNVTKENFYVDDIRVAVRRSNTEPVTRNELPLNVFVQNFSPNIKSNYNGLIDAKDSISYLHITPSDLFTSPFVVDFDSVSSNILPSKINVSFSYKSINLNDNIKLAFEFRNKESQNRSFYYYQVPNYYQNEWQRSSTDVYIPEEYRYNGEMISYFWNIGQNELNVERVKYVFF